MHERSGGRKRKKVPTNKNIIGAQWGDECKGKVVDLYAEGVDLVVRFGGGANAGHRMVVNGVPYVTQLVPSGVVRGKEGVIANGCAVDVESLLREMDTLTRAGCDVRLSISNRAPLLLPWHKVIDASSENMKGAQKIGTTRRGIGPCYADHYNRIGLMVGALRDPERLREELWRHREQRLIANPSIASDPRLNPENFIDDLLVAGGQLKPFIVDTAELLHTALERGKKVLLEGAQGCMLDIHHGTYPFVTSSSTTAGGMCSGTGLANSDIGTITGVAKCYVTRVGEGPLPTELSSLTGPGKHLAEVGNEFGTVTGRARRVGWLDLPQLRFAKRRTGMRELAIMKLDVLSGLKSIQVCTAYRLPDGSTITRFPSETDLFSQVEPVYTTFEGWDNLGDGTYDGLPAAARSYLDFIEEDLDCLIVLIGTGPERHQVIVR